MAKSKDSKKNSLTKETERLKQNMPKHEIGDPSKNNQNK